VQESLSNAVRHGAPRTVLASIARIAGELSLEIANDGATASDGAPGRGLTGMAERVAAAGGTLSAGPAAAGGWRVAATLPLPAASRDEAA